MNQIALSDAKINTEYRVVSINAPPKVKRRLLELGFVNCSVKVVNKSSMGGVFLVQIRDYLLAIKKEELNNVWVKLWLI